MDLPAPETPRMAMRVCLGASGVGIVEIGGFCVYDWDS